MHVERPSFTDGRISLAVSDSTGNEAEIYYASPHVSESVNFTVPLNLLPSMAKKEPLTIETPASEALLNQSERIQHIYRLFYGFSTVSIEAESSTSTEKRSGVGCFFTGGVDSFHALLSHRHEVTHLIFVHGFDAPLQNAWAREQASKAAHQSAAELGIEAIEVETNLRAFSNPLVGWGEYHGAALASVAMTLPLSKVIIPASHTYADLFPWGSHPALDPLWSTESLEIAHEGCEATRVEKVAYISQHPSALRWLRVCPNHPKTSLNCGRCEKCVRTRVNLRIAGALEQCETLPHDLTADEVRSIEVQNESDLAFTVENHSALVAAGEKQLAAALSAVIDDYQRNAAENGEATRLRQELERVRAHYQSRRYKWADKLASLIGR